MTERASEHPAVAAYARHVNPAFVKLLGVLGYGRLYTRARGVHVWDHSGQRYLDCLAGFGAVNLGHNHPRMIVRLQQALDQDLPNLMHLGPSPQVAELATALAEAAGPPLEITLLSSGGAEAVEAGLKLARAATGRQGVVYCDGGFHGTSLGTLSIMGAPRMRAPFEPLLDGCRAVPFGDTDALAAALGKGDVGAFVVEPIQAEAGVVLPPPGYLAAAQALCHAHGAVLVLDEIQTGLGRTGAVFAFQDEGFVPDVLVLAKSLSGGLLPVAATLTSRALHRRAYGRADRFDLHSSTFAGNPLSAIAATETLRIIHDEGLAEAARARGRQLLTGLRGRLEGHPFVRDVRGRGLLVGIELGSTGRGLTSQLAPGLVDELSRQVFGQWLALRLLERHVLCQPASHHWNVLRLEPPLIISEAQIDALVGAVGDVLDTYRNLARLLADVSVRLSAQAFGGYPFG